MSEAHDNHARPLRMAQQIADFFRSYPQDEAARAIADHINQFWTPRMRADFAAGGQPGDPLLSRAMPLIRQRRADSAKA